MNDAIGCGYVNCAGMLVERLVAAGGDFDLNRFSIGIQRWNVSSIQGESSYGVNGTGNHMLA